MSGIRPFRCAVPEADIADLHRRLDHTRWPPQAGAGDWSCGADRAYLRELVGYWRHDFDWRRAEDGLNALDQYLLAIDGIDTHFIHQRSPHAGAVPLLLCHGWPGSVVEFLALIPRLTEPERFGGSPEDAFHVVCPSLPGYGFSAPLPAVDNHVLGIARRHGALMAALGYGAYIAQGGDWGSAVTRLQPVVDPACRAIHVNFLRLPPPAVADPMALVTPAERERLARAEAHQREGTGYYAVQTTRPQGLAFGLSDSPAGLCAWITEKFHAWSDCGGDLRQGIGWDPLLTNIGLYWFTNTLGSSIRLYRDNSRGMAEGRVSFPPPAVPVGVAVYPGEIGHTPRAWAEAALPLAHWFEAERGGHFAAMEQPEIFAADLRQFRRVVDAAIHP